MASVGTMVRDHMYEASMPTLRAFPVGEEEQNHDGREAGGDDALTDHTLDGSAHIERLVKEGGDFHAFGDRVFVVLEHALDAVNDGDSGSAASLVDTHEHAALSVG